MEAVPACLCLSADKTDYEHMSGKTACSSGPNPIIIRTHLHYTFF